MTPKKCPICETVFDADGPHSGPFCSPRCRRIDLGRWLGERYSVPVVRRRPGDASTTDGGFDSDPED
jgi:endogenous inhibitor of DNA gyrase (YacG/DUF329 family)